MVVNYRPYCPLLAVESHVIETLTDDSCDRSLVFSTATEGLSQRRWGIGVVGQAVVPEIETNLVGIAAQQL